MAKHHFSLGNLEQSHRFATQAAALPGEGQSIAASISKEIDALNNVAPKSIGIILPLSGPLAAFGKKTLAAIGIALETKLDPNNQPRSSFMKDDLNLIVVDSKGDSVAAEQAVDNLVKQDRVALIIGDITNEAALLSAKKSQQLNVPMLTFSRHADIAAAGNHVFVFNATVQKHVDNLIDHAMANGITRFGILFPKHNYGMSMSKCFFDTVIKKGGTVTAIEDYDAELSSFAEPARKLLGKFYTKARPEYRACLAEKKPAKLCLEALKPSVDFEALFLPDFPQKLAPLIPTLIAEGLLVSDVPYDVRSYAAATKTLRPSVVTLLGPSTWATGLEKTFPKISGAYFVDSVSFEQENLKQFAATFKEQTGTQATPLEVFAHDAAKLAEKIARENHSAGIRARHVYREKIASFKGSVGLLGPIEFLANRELNTKDVGFLVRNGNAQPVVTKENTL